MAEKPCHHPPDVQLRLEGGIYLYCAGCGALKRHLEGVWDRPKRDQPPEDKFYKHNPEEM